MTPDQLRRIAQAATKGPWEARADDADMLHIVHDSEYLSYICTVGGKETPNAEDDAEFIETFNPQKVLELLDQIEQLQAVVRDSHDECTYQARLAAVEKLHRKTMWHCGNAQHTNPEVGCPDCAYICTGCGEVWPCLTSKTIKGDPK